MAMTMSSVMPLDAERIVRCLEAHDIKVPDMDVVFLLETTPVLQQLCMSYDMMNAWAVDSQSEDILESMLGVFSDAVACTYDRLARKTDKPSEIIALKGLPRTEDNDYLFESRSFIET